MLDDWEEGKVLMCVDCKRRMRQVITLLKNIDDPIEIEKLRSDDDKYRLNLKRDGYATPAPSWLRLDSFPVGSWFLSSGQMWVARPPPRCGHPKFSLSFLSFFFGKKFFFFKKN
jgi:hypothetical protein